MLASSSALPGDGVRGLNVNLLTQFPRRRPWAPYLLGYGRGVLGVALAGYFVLGVAVGFLAAWLGGGWAIASLVLTWIWLALLLLAHVVAVPRLGVVLQWLRQFIGGTQWAIDLFQAFRTMRPWRFLIVFVVAHLAGSGLIALVWWLVPTSPWWLGLVSLLLSVLGFAIAMWVFVLWLDRRGRGLGKRSFMALPSQVQRLSMVHALSWTILPPFTNQKGKKARFRPLLFVTSFDEGVDGYVGGFVETFDNSLRGPWGLAPNFPAYRGKDDLRTGNTPTSVAEHREVDQERGFLPYLEYVQRTEDPLDHSYSAYPHLSTTDVRAALQIDRELRSLLLDATVPGQALNGVPAGRYQQFLTSVRHALPAVAAPIPNLDLGAAFAPPTSADSSVTSRRETTILVSWFELGAAADIAVLRQLFQTRFGVAANAGFPGLGGYASAINSYFHRVPGTHIARLSVVAPYQKNDWFDWPRVVDRNAIHFEEHTMNPDQDLQPTTGFVVLAAHIDGPAVPWLERLHFEVTAADPALIDDVATAMGVSPPAGPEASAIFADYVMSHRHEPLIRHVDRAEVTIYDTLRALDTHRRFSTDLVNPGAPALGLGAIAPYRT